MKTLLTAALFGLITTISFGQQYRLGLDFNDMGSQGADMYESESFGFGDELPDSVSLLEYAPYPGNQGNHGTCVGWSFGYCGLTTLYARQFGIKNRNVITAMAMCPYTVYNNIKSSYDTGCTEGSHLNDAGEFLTSTGSKRFYVHQSDCGTTDEVDEAIMIFKADSYAPLWEWYPGIEWDEDAKIESDKAGKAKQALADGHVVLIGMSVPTSFCEGTNENGEWIKSDNSWENEGGGGHAMCVIGYDDNRLGGTFEIQNSWGQDWGKGGYVYVRYEDFQEYVRCAGVMELDDNNKYTDMARKKGCLFGDCEGDYSRFTFENGDTYEGLIKNGMPEGSGIYQWSDGELYAGEFKGGLKDGRGTYYFADGTKRQGYWKEDEFRADLEYLDYSYSVIDLGGAEWKGYVKGKAWLYGTYYSYWGDPVYEGKFTDDGAPDEFGLLNTYGEKILAEFKEGNTHGLSLAIDDYYTSLYVCEEDDCNPAPESMIATDVQELPNMDEAAADTVTAQSDNCSFGECENGYSHYSYATGNDYKGFLMNGWRHGMGTYTFKTGDVLSFEGNYKNGKKEGIGRVMFRDGSWFIGDFEDGLANGNGLWKRADGKVQYGVWEDGEFVEEDNGFGFADNEPVKLNQEAKADMNVAQKREPKRFKKPVVLK